MPKVFLSYRRNDSQDVSGRIYDRLAAAFGNESVFMDIDSIPFGVDFRDFLTSWVSQCDVLIAVIGGTWLSSQDGRGKSRLGHPEDFVTIEIVAALERKIPVIPVLVGRATMPSASQLPKVLIPLSYRNAAEVRSGRDFHTHMDRLIRGIEHHFSSTNALSAVKASSTDASSVTQITTASQPPAVKQGPWIDLKLPDSRVEPPAVPTPTNLGFEGGDIVSQNIISQKFVDDVCPLGWFNSVGYVKDVSTQYKINTESRFGYVDTKFSLVGKNVSIRCSKADQGEFGSIMQRCPAGTSIGKRIQIAAELCTEVVENWAGLWLRIDGSSKQLFFDNMSDRAITGSTPWTWYAIETTIPADSQWLNYGVVLAGNGVVRADNFRVRVSDKSS